MAGYGDDRLDYLFKVVIVGESGVGKTSLLLQYVDQIFSETFIATIGVDFKIKTLDFDGKKVKLQIWDTAGQDRFRNIVSTFYRNAHAILVVYDITDALSFSSTSHWMREIERYAKNDTRLVLVGNKSDREDKRQVSTEEAASLASRQGMMHMETSARTSTNVETLFTHLSKELMAHCQPICHDKKDKKDTLGLPPSHKVATGGICNC